MGDRKKWIYDCLESEEVSAYFQKMLDAQTSVILENMEHQQNDRNSEKIHELEQRCQQEKDRRKKSEIEKESLQEQIVQEKKNQERLKCEYEDRIHQMETEKAKLRKALEVYNVRYRRLDEAYVRYGELSPEIRDRLRNIFRTDSIYELIAACSDWRNVEGIWQFAKRRIVEKELKDAENLAELFVFMAEVYNEQGNEKKYALIKPNVGERFDSDWQIIIGTKTDGIISRVRLHGIVSADSGKVLQKALVEV